MPVHEGAAHVSMRVEFPTTLDVRFHHLPEGVRWELLSTFVVIVNGMEADQRIIRVPGGFLTDFASVPRLPIVYMAYANRAHLPAIAHDFLYREGGTEEDREYADNVFLHGMLGTLVPDGENSLTEEDAYQMYNGVRLGGASRFNFK
mgnify:CR=1 FL=1